MKNFFALLIIGVMTISSSILAFAKTGTQNTTITYNNIKIVVDGKEVNYNTEPFIYDGTTYLPVRDIGEAIGKDVNWDGNNNTVYIGDMPNTQTSPNLNTTDYSKQLSVGEWFYKDILDNTWYVQQITNNSNETLEINANVTAKDSNGNVIGAKTGTEYAVDSGKSVLMKYLFDSNNIKTFDYSITAKKSNNWSKSAVDDIKTDIKKSENKLIVTCTNVGTEPARFVEVTALFFKNGTAIDSGFTYCVDSESELKAGNTIVKEINIYDDFDDYIFAVTARR